MFNKDPLKKWKKKKKNNKLFLIIGIIFFFIIVFILLLIGSKENNILKIDNVYVLKSEILSDQIITLTPNETVSGEIEISQINLGSTSYILKSLILINNEYILNDNQNVLVSFSSLFDEPFGIISNLDNKIIKIFIENKTDQVQNLKFEVSNYSEINFESNISNIYYEGDIEFSTFIDTKQVDSFPKSENYLPQLNCYSNKEKVETNHQFVWEVDHWEISLEGINSLDLKCNIIFETLKEE